MIMSVCFWGFLSNQIQWDPPEMDLGDLAAAPRVSVDDEIVASSRSYEDLVRRHVVRVNDFSIWIRWRNVFKQRLLVFCKLSTTIP